MLKCPLCENAVPVSLLDMLISTEIKCPSCGIKLVFPKNPSYRTISHLFDSKRKKKQL